ncbi:MAG TPA: HAD hydrolase-like protein [Solirubrobacteraceae bacterium]|nr:HAD hydrolase-like protein [Solirubrobacteraceae bacterium]
MPGLSWLCACRSPRPNAARRHLRARHRPRASWMVGDTDADVGAGQAAGRRTLLIEHPGSIHKRAPGIWPDPTAPDMARGAALLLGA